MCISLHFNVIWFCVFKNRLECQAYFTEPHPYGGWNSVEGVLRGLSSGVVLAVWWAVKDSPAVAPMQSGFGLFWLGAGRKAESRFNIKDPSERSSWLGSVSCCFALVGPLHSILSTLVDSIYKLSWHFPSLPASNYWCGFGDICIKGTERRWQQSVWDMTTLGTCPAAQSQAYLEDLGVTLQKEAENTLNH